MQIYFNMLLEGFSIISYRYSIFYISAKIWNTKCWIISYDLMKKKNRFVHFYSDPISGKVAAKY